MNETTARKIRLGYGIVLSIFTGVLAILFIIGVTDIYDGGAGKYSREIVAQHLKPLMIVMIVWILAIIGGYVLSVVLPSAQKQKKGTSALTAVKRLKNKIPQGQSEEFLAEQKRYHRMELIKIVIWSVCAVFALVGAIMIIVYLATPANFSLAGDVHPNTVIVRMVRFVLPWVAASMLLFIGATLYERFTAKKELEIIKKLIVLGKGAPAAEESALIAKRDAALKVAGSWQVKLALRCALFAIAVVFIVIGALDGGFVETMTKAINICTECIGLG